MSGRRPRARERLERRARRHRPSIATPPRDPSCLPSRIRVGCGARARRRDGPTLVRDRLVPRVGRHRIGRSALGLPFRLASDRPPVGVSLIGGGHPRIDGSPRYPWSPLRGGCRPPLEATPARSRRGDRCRRWHPSRHAPHAIRAPGERETSPRSRDALCHQLRPSGSVAGRSSNLTAARRRARDNAPRHALPVATAGIVGPDSVSLCSPASRLSACAPTPLRGASAWTPAPAHARPDGP